ncbi:glycoside hydrolase family 16 protein, partial [Baudoinia panamericana UAMH 10762]
LFTLPAATLALSSCNCGYTLNTTSLFTHAIQTDFTHPDASLTWTDSPSADWAVQVYNVSPTAARGPYGKAAELSTVLLNSSSSTLDLYVRSQLLPNTNGTLGSSDLRIPISEIATTRNDILYGTFRASIQFSSVPGTCGAFFFYHNDSQEIDMEVLSQQQQSARVNSNGTHPINLVNQSPVSVTQGYNDVGTVGFVPYNLPFDPTEGWHEYRFDWLPDRIDKFADGAWLTTFTEDVPNRAGGVHLSHWSNGDPGWSGGPPGGDAVVRVRWVEAYFNTT